MPVAWTSLGGRASIGSLLWRSSAASGDPTSARNCTGPVNRVLTPAAGLPLQAEGVSVPVANGIETMQPLTNSRSRTRRPREISLLRKSVGALDAGRHRCWHCHRTPLVGEHVHMYGERLVCELCRHLRREPPAATVVVHSPEHQRAVKLRTRAA